MKKFYVGGELLKKAPNCNLLYHQYRTVEALESNSVIFNTYPTGSGKTRAALQRLIDNPQDNVLFIAPTNELLVQHSEDIKEFVRENNLNFKVVRIDAKVIQKIKVDKPHLRKGTILYEVLRNPLQYKEQLGIENLKGKVVIIVNPDIFYYCLYGLYGKLDKGNLIDSIITKYNYIIIDEFHYYNSKQLTNFLFFMFLSKELGYLDGIRKFCILTATPDKLIEKYLTRGGIDYQIISPDNEPKESKDYEKLNTLSKMELVVTNGSLAETVVGYYNNRDKEEDSVVISQSLNRVNKIKQSLKEIGIGENYVGVITGVVGSQERKNAVNKKIILATPTVDIGYNFKKIGKDRQNIDLVITEAESSDQALQRIGRAGRILGKKIQGDSCKVILCVKDNIYENFSEVTGELSRKELKRLIETAMPERTIMKKYIETEAIIELCFPLEDLYNKFPYRDRDRIIGGLFNNLIEVFAPRKSYSFKSKINEIKQYKKEFKFLIDYENSNDKDEFITSLESSKILNNTLLVEALNELGNLDTPIDLDTINEYDIEEINEVKQAYKNILISYIKIKNCKIKALLNFRGASMGIPTLVHDPYNLFSQESKIIKYDIFHIIRNCNISWYGDKKQVYNALKNGDVVYESAIIDECDFFLIVESLKEKPAEITLEYNSECNKKDFEKKYRSDVKAINRLILTALENDKRGVIIPEEVRKYFKDEYIPILIAMDSKAEFQIEKIIKNQSVYFQKLTVNFQNEASKVYKVITGSSAVIVNSEIVRLRDKSEKEESLIF